MNNTDISVCQEALSKTKIRLMATPDTVFFTSMCFSLIHKFSESVPTAATDGKHIFFNPEFFMNLTPDERVFLLLHETMHCAYLHMFRAKALELDPRKSNIAADHVINLMLIERGFKMPKEGLADPQYKGMSMEEVYALLPEDPEPPPMEDLMDPAGEAGDATQAAEIERSIQDALIRAATQANLANNSPGSIPGDIQIFLNKLLNPKLPWQTILRRYLQSFAKDDYTWKKPNRRYFPGHYLPSLHSESLIDIAIAIDTSGSVSDEEFTQFISEVHSIMKMMKPPKISLIQFDTEIKSVDQIVDLGGLSRVVFSGRGGTYIEPVIDWAKNNKPKLLLVFTDGYFRNPRDSLKQDTLWLIHSNPSWKAPFGKAIHYKLKG